MKQPGKSPQDGEILLLKAETLDRYQTGMLVGGSSLERERKYTNE